MKKIVYLLIIGLLLGTPLLNVGYIPFVDATTTVNCYLAKNTTVYNGESFWIHGYFNPSETIGTIKISVEFSASLMYIDSSNVGNNPDGWGFIDGTINNVIGTVNYTQYASMPATSGNYSWFIYNCTATGIGTCYMNWTYTLVKNATLGDCTEVRHNLSFTITESPSVPGSTIIEFGGIEPLYTAEYIEVAISINPKEAIAGAQFDMSFDPSMLSADWVAEGDLFSEYDTYFNPGVIDNTNGTLKNVISLITTPGGSTTNQGSIAIVAIRAKTIPGETPLDLSNVIVGRPDATPIDVTIINTTVTIYRHDRWDVNWDDRVNILDLILIGQWWDETGTPCWVSADVNCDGVINILDMILVGQHWTG